MENKIDEAINLLRSNGYRVSISDRFNQKKYLYKLSLKKKSGYVTVVYVVGRGKFGRRSKEIIKIERADFDFNKLDWVEVKNEMSSLQD